MQHLKQLCWRWQYENVYQVEAEGKLTHAVGGMVIVHQHWRGERKKLDFVCNFNKKSLQKGMYKKHISREWWIW